MRLVISLLVFVGVFASDTQMYMRVQANLLIGDYRSAIAECQAGLKHYPESKPLQRALVQALSVQGFEKDALTAWHVVADRLEGEEKRTTLEGLAWGVLARAGDSDQFAVQYSSLLGARRARDAEAVTVVKSRLRSTNALMRALAIKIACEFRDASLIHEIKHLFANERNFFVRLEAIRAVGYLGLKEMRAQLQDIVADDRTMAEEKACAIESLVNLYESVSDDELREFAEAKRGGLRALAPQIVLHLNAKDKLKTLVPLLKDRSSFVRILTLGAFGYLDPCAFKDEIEPLCSDPDPLVAITANWCMLFVDAKQASKRLEGFMDHELESVRYVAASAAASSGAAGLPLCQKLTTRSYDPYIRANAAVGLILSNKRIKKASHALYALVEGDEKLMWERMHHPFFRTLTPSKVRHIPQLPNYPAHVDQLTRLEILSMLSILDYRKAKSGMQSFLEKGEWGITHAACATLIGEGGFEALETVKALLKSSDVKVRVQAALVLAFIGHDPDAIDVLQKAYPQMVRDQKLTVLEALGAIGSQRSLPFLVEVLSEPFQVTRVIAASSIIQCLYH